MATGSFIDPYDQGGLFGEYRPPTPTLSYRVFLSSGSDLTVQRDQFKEICDQLNTQLAMTNSRIRIDLKRWEDQGSFKVQNDANERFRQLAIESHLTVVLLADSIRTGTQDELEAALSENKVQLEILWMRSTHPGQARKPPGLGKLERYLKTKQEQVIWTQCEGPGSFSSIIHMYRILTTFIFRNIALLDEPDGGGFNEER